MALKCSLQESIYTVTQDRGGTGMVRQGSQDLLFAYEALRMHQDVSVSAY